MSREDSIKKNLKFFQEDPIQAENGIDINSILPVSVWGVVHHNTNSYAWSPYPHAPPSPDTPYSCSGRKSFAPESPRIVSNVILSSNKP